MAFVPRKHSWLLHCVISNKETRFPAFPGAGGAAPGIHGAAPPATREQERQHHTSQERRMSKIDTIELTSINSFGAVYKVAGTWKGKSYSIKLYCEYDGRDVDSQSDGYNPMDYDPMEVPGALFFDVLCEDERFIDLHNKGYAAWELFPRQ